MSVKSRVGSQRAGGEREGDSVGDRRRVPGSQVGLISISRLSPNGCVFALQENPDQGSERTGKRLLASVRGVKMFEALHSFFRHLPEYGF
jgi:hypothetical protein